IASTAMNVDINEPRGDVLSFGINFKDIIRSNGPLAYHFNFAVCDQHRPTADYSPRRDDVPVHYFYSSRIHLILVKLKPCTQPNTHLRNEDSPFNILNFKLWTLRPDNRRVPLSNL